MITRFVSKLPILGVISNRYEYGNLAFR